METYPAMPATTPKGMVTDDMLRQFGIFLLVVISALYTFLVSAAKCWRRRRTNHAQRKLDTYATSNQGSEVHNNDQQQKKHIDEYDGNSISSSGCTDGAQILMMWTFERREIHTERFYSDSFYGELPDGEKQERTEDTTEDLEQALAEYTGSSSCFSPHFYTTNTPQAFISEDVQL